MILLSAPGGKPINTSSYLSLSQHYPNPIPITAPLLPEAVRMILLSAPGGKPCRDWKMALCSESAGSMLTYCYCWMVVMAVWLRVVCDLEWLESNCWCCSLRDCTKRLPCAWPAVVRPQARPQSASLCSPARYPCLSNRVCYVGGEVR